MLHTLDSMTTMFCPFLLSSSVVNLSPYCRGTQCALLACKRVQTKKTARENGAPKFEYRYWCGLMKAGSMVPADMLNKEPFERKR